MSGKRAHAFIKLKRAGVEQYAMIVPKKALAHWQSLGWLTYEEVGLPKGDESAFMLYGDLKKRTHTLVFNQPATLREKGADHLLGLEVQGCSPYLGTYGMGGPGFLGLLLSTGDYLVYAVWSAAEYVLLDGRPLACSPTLYHKARPWVSLEGDGMRWEDLHARLMGCTISGVLLEAHSLVLTLEKDGLSMAMRFVKNDPLLPKDTAMKRNAYKRGEIADWLLFQYEGARLLV